MPNFFKSLGFEIIRINGSHHRLKHRDGRVTTVPVHQNVDLPKGLIRKIIIEDLEMELEDIFGNIIIKNSLSLLPHLPNPLRYIINNSFIDITRS